jgi:hypothetical protein
MSNNTYVAIETKTLDSAVSSVTFTSIPQGYTDLILISSFAYSANNLDFRVQVGNNTIDGGSNYSSTHVMSNGSTTPTSDKTSSNTYIPGYRLVGGGTSRQIAIHQFQNYSNTQTYKNVLYRTNAASAELLAGIGVWRSTSAINTITLGPSGVPTFTVGSTFTLYGISNSNINSPKAFGGTVTKDANYTYHTFGASGTFTPQQSLTCDYLVIAGGGGSSSFASGGGTGGGGAGGLRSTLVATGGGGSLESAITVTAQPYTITVGGGGAFVNGANGNPGTSSTFSTVTSTGGGFGAYSGNGGNGGSGGGGYGYPASTYTGGTRVTGQGFAGGNGTTDGATWTASAGGGGAGAVGTNATSVGAAGNGGVGVSIPVIATATGTGVDTYYAGGGGGGTTKSNGDIGFGGLGGGGRGATQGSSGSNAIANTGGGGGAAGGAGATVAGNGGSGIVIIRYAN